MPLRTVLAVHHKDLFNAHFSTCLLHNIGTELLNVRYGLHHTLHFSCVFRLVAINNQIKSFLHFLQPCTFMEIIGIFHRISNQYVKWALDVSRKFVPAKDAVVAFGPDSMLRLLQRIVY